MRHTAYRRTRPGARREQGFILVTGLLFLVVMTLIGLALFRSTGLLDRLTANTRDKQRSFEAAEAAVEYGVWWLQQSSGGTVGSCASNSNATVGSIKVCSEALSTSLTTIAAVDASGSWATKAFSYTPPNMTVNSTTNVGGMNSGGTDVIYWKAPGLYPESLGLSADGKTKYYQITAYGYGGDSNTVTVVRGTFKQVAQSTNRGNQNP
jgi:type IV pilus assembly protein PilX